jgi:hypothetical protein
VLEKPSDRYNDNHVTMIIGNYAVNAYDAKVGYMDGGTLRLLLRRRLNLGVKEIRRTF